MKQSIIDKNDDKANRVLAERFIHFYNRINNEREAELTQDYIKALLDCEIRSANMLYNIETLDESPEQHTEDDKRKRNKLRNIILGLPLNTRLALFDYFVECGPEEAMKTWVNVEGDLYS